MLKEVSAFPLTTSDIESLSKCTQEVFIKKDYTIFYDGQIPHLAICLVSGDLYLEKRKKIRQHFKGPTLCAYKECLKGRPVKFDLKVKKGSVLLFLSKSLLNNDELDYILKEVFMNSSLEKA